MPTRKITEEEILLQATILFRKKGYHNTSMSDLAEVCGLTKGLFYHYFKDKQQMMEAVLRSVRKVFTAKVFSIAYQNELTTTERGKMMAIKCLNLFSDGSGGCLMGNTLLETVHTYPQFKVHLRAFFDEWIDAFEQLFNSNPINQDPLQMAREAVGEIEGAIMLMQLYDDQSFLEKALKRVIKRV